MVPLVLLGAMVACCVAMLLADLDSLTIGVVTLVLMILLLAAGVPIGFAMMGSSVVGLFSIAGERAATASTSAIVYDSVASWTLNVVPLFVLMGVAMWKGGVTARAYVTARQWLNWMPGGLAVATNFSGAALATSSGSTMGITFALARMSLPEMLRAGYKPSLATGSVTMAGTLGQIIPPSILLIIYAGVASVPVGPQLLAGIVPGILLAVGFVATVVIWATVSPSAAPRLDASDITWRSRFHSLPALLPLLLVMSTVIGGMFFGFFTASEAAALGALMALVVSWIMLGRGHRGPRATAVYLRDSVLETVTSIAGLFIILVGAAMLTRVLALSGLTREITAKLIDLELARVELLLILVVVYIILGMFLESLPMILLTVPLLQPPLEAMGVDMIWFGIFIVIMCEIGMVFPPIGMLVFIVHRLAQNPAVSGGVRVTLGDVYRGVMPFVGVTILVTVAFIIWPDIVMWLPNR
jgi:C4-dicarboxylate transporter DctM subunit